MHLQNDKKFKKEPVFVPKRMQIQRKPIFINNSVNFERETSPNVSTVSKLYNGFTPRSKSSIPLASRLSNSMPVKAEVNQTIENTITNRAVIESNNLLKNSSKMTAIKSILKSKQTDCVSNNTIKTIHLELVNGRNFGNKPKSQENTDHKNTRRKSSIVQFDIQNDKDSSQVHWNTTPRMISPHPTTISNSRLSIARQSISSNQSISNDFPKVSQRMSDLRKILNPEIEKEDTIKKLGHAIIHCECFELNLNNAAKIITAVVLLATFILVIHSLFKDV